MRKHADNATIPAKSKAVPKEIDGVPNPETDHGRVEILKKTSLGVHDLVMRARIMEKIIDKALGSKSREDYKEQLVLLTDSVTALKQHDVPNLVKALLSALETYEKSRGRKLDVNNLDEYKKQTKAAAKSRSTRSYL